MSVMDHKSTLDSVIEFHRARLVGLDNWVLAQKTMLLADDPVHDIAQALGISDLGAHSVIAMLRAPRPERSQIVEQVNMLERLQEAAESHHDARRRRTLARSGARHVLV